MAGISEIKQHIKVVDETEQIARAMHLISISKMKRLQGQSVANREYMRKLRVVMKEILLSSKQVKHPFLQKHREDDMRTAYVVIASDKTLCGPYNNNILEAAYRHMQGREAYVLSVGFMTTEFFRARNIVEDTAFLHTAQNPSLYNARRVARTVIDKYQKGEAGEVYVAFTEHVSQAKQLPTVMRLLPMSLDDFADIPDEDVRAHEMLYHPSAHETFDNLAPQYVIGMLYSALMQSSMSEHCARMMAMETAMHNAQDMIGQLTLEYHRARQDKITEEIIEISSAAAELLSDYT